MRDLAPLALATISGIVLWKLFAAVLVPVLLMALGLVGTLVKFALIGAALFAAYTMIKKRREAVEG